MPRIKAPCCGRQVSPITVNNGLCGHCRREKRRSEDAGVSIEWNDVRRLRTRLLAQTDWTQMADQPDTRKNNFAALRQELRDITKNYPTASEAWTKLNELKGIING